MNQYNRIYHLHICKTGGRFYHSKVLKPANESISEKIKLTHDLGGHYGWPIFMSPKTFIVAGIRDVVKQQCSLFVDVNITKKKMVYSYNDAKEVFLSWIEKENFAKNNMSKHFLYNKNFGDWGSKLPPPEEKHMDLIIERSNRVNLYYNIENNFNYEHLTRQLAKEIGTEIKINPNIDSLPVEPNKGSEILYQSLTDEEKDFIKSMSPLDVKLYDHIQNKINFHSDNF